MSDDDDDVSAMWREHKAADAERRRERREAAPKELRAAGIRFDSRNGGAHLILSTTPIIDFWPGTTQWTIRGSFKPRYGLKKLIDYCSAGK